MTSEIIIMNRSAVALAADSAATVTGEKIFTANKIFMLSKFTPIGVMLYGNSHFMGIPWETIIKEFRRYLAREKFDCVDDYANHFLEYINNNKTNFSESNNFSIFHGTSNGVLIEVRDLVLKRVEQKIKTKGSVTDEDIIGLINEEITKIEKNLSEIKFPDCFTGDEVNFLINEYSKDTFSIAIKTIFENLPIEIFKERLKVIIATIYISKILVTDFRTGLVFVGFGERDIFPLYLEFNFFGFLNKKLMYNIGRRGVVNVDHSTCISSFAQGDMIQTFMEGIAPDLKTFYDQTIPGILDEYKNQITALLDIKDDKITEIKGRIDEINSRLIHLYNQRISELKQQNHITPVLSIVTHLPKEELAEMAESLVNLTSLKRRVSNDPESVGGPIDVAVISKGDGFIWMKRKHYFDIKLNPHFVNNYYQEV